MTSLTPERIRELIDEYQRRANILTKVANADPVIADGRAALYQSLGEYTDTITALRALLEEEK